MDIQRWMDRQNDMDGRMDGQTVRQRDRWIYREGWTDRMIWMDGQMYRRTDRWIQTDGWMDMQMNRLIDGYLQIDGLMDGCRWTDRKTYG